MSQITEEKKPSPELEAMLKELQIRGIDVPDKALFKWEWTYCNKPGCTKAHGPYIYAYWKEGGKLHKRYIGKSIEAWEKREVGITYSELNKLLDDLEAGLI
jgi:hypothetical protein